MLDMSEATIRAAAVLGAVVATAYLGVGLVLARRAWHARSRSRILFALFWLGVGTYAAVEAAWVAAHLGGIGGLPLALLVLHVKIASLTAGFAGLVAYLLIVYTGRTWTSLVAGAYYAGLLVALEAFYFWRGPFGVREGIWGMQLVYERGAVEPYWTLVLALLLVPVLAAAVAFATLVRVVEREQRMRILLTAASLLVFLAPSLVAWSRGGWYWWGLTEKLLSLAAALGMIGAAWMGVREDAHRALSLHRARREAQLRARARELI